MENKELLEKIEKYIEEGNKSREELRVLVLKMHVKIYGNDDANPPIEGMEDRLKALESVEVNRVRNIDRALKIAVGSITFAVGGAVIWVFTVIKDAFTKGH